MTTVADPKAEKKEKRPSTAHFKVVPETRRAARSRSAPRPAAFGKTIDRSRLLTKPALQKMAEELLAPHGPRRAVPRLHDGLHHQRVLARADPGHRFQAPAAAAAALPQARRGLPRRLRRVRPRLQEVRRLLRRRLQDQGRGPRLQGARLRRHADRPQDHRQRPRRRHRRRRLPQRAGKGDRQDPAGRHPVRGGPAAVEQLPQHVGR